jgi:hypothetical protein
MIYTHVLNRGGHGVRSPLDTIAALAPPDINTPYHDHRRRISSAPPTRAPHEPAPQNGPESTPRRTPRVLP